MQKTYRKKFIVRLKGDDRAAAEVRIDNNDVVRIFPLMYLKGAQDLDPGRLEYCVTKAFNEMCGAMTKKGPK